VPRGIIAARPLKNKKNATMLVTVVALLLRLAAMLARLPRWRTLGLVTWLSLRPARSYRRLPDGTCPIHQRAKPEWVRKEIIRLKALIPHAGCRTIADSFNRRFAASRRMTVG
jgi:hypothetical protein